eukprot:TRINITY_DN13736_c0_g1_i1.p1 TRINITY_DN13736_c0_g1~~TRINITY_DN13736_c0_g1_i1.p1  ORF type:complete len:101 (-),score=18.76 TRINITY_DN13736_c0_g1_i1:123-386(-)
MAQHIYDIPFVKTFLDMPAKEMTAYYSKNFSLANLREGGRSFVGWYRYHYFQQNRINPLFHFMFISSSMMYWAVWPWHKLKHDLGMH